MICRHGAPQELLSDCGKIFMPNLVQVCKLFDIKKLNTVGYHPQTNVLCERFNSTLIQMLAKVEKDMFMIGINIFRMYCMLIEFRYRSLPRNFLSF